MFLGNYKHSLDSKNRLSLPAKIRNQIQSDFVMVTLAADGCLEVRTPEEFNQYSTSLCALGNLNSDHRKIQRHINGNTFEISIDNANRILLPTNLISHKNININKDVVIVGVNNKLEIWDAKKYEEISNQNDDEIFDLMNKIDNHV